MKKYIFFIREYNDWDNLAPIIYYIAKNNSSKICIFFYKKDLRNTNLFKYLNQKVGGNLEIFYQQPDKFNIFYSFLIKIINKFFKIFKFKINFKINENLQGKVVQKWFKIMNLKQYSRIICVFDRTIDPILEIVQNQLKSLDCVFISCPHGPMTNTNRMIYKNQLKRSKNFCGLESEKTEEIKKFLHFYNYLVFTDHIQAKLTEKYCIPIEKNKVDKLQIKVLGSIRYCKEWLNHVENFSPKILNKNNEKVKVVFFLKKFQQNVFKSEVYRTLEIFALYPNIEFYIKPHTRGMVFPSKLKAANVHIDIESSSSSLINMADVIFFYGGTSIYLKQYQKKN